MTSLHPRAIPGGGKAAAHEFFHDPAEGFATFEPIALRLPYQMRLRDGFEAAVCVRHVVNECDANEMGIDAVNAADFGNKSRRGQRIVPIRFKLHHFNFPSRPAAHIAANADSPQSPHLWFLSGLFCHDSVAFLRLSRKILIPVAAVTGAQPATTRSGLSLIESPEFGRCRSSADRRLRHTRPHAGGAAVIPNPIPALPDSSRGRNLGRGRFFAKRAPPAFFSHQQTKRYSTVCGGRVSQGGYLKSLSLLSMDAV